MASSLSFIPAVEQLSSRIIRILGCNPGPFTLQGTNTYLLGTGRKRILIDSGEKGNTQYIENLGKVLKDCNVTIQEMIVTHWHRDHIGGVSDVSSLVNAGEPLSMKKFKRISKMDDPMEKNVSLTFLEDNATFSIEGATLRALYTPGHTDDHISLLLEEDNALFSGDCILGEGSAVFEDLHDYMKSLELIRSLKLSAIYPGHGPVVEQPDEHIDKYISNRNNRERQILGALSDGAAKSSMEIVEIIYVATPKSMYNAAEFNVLAHLGKLLKEKRVEKIENGDNLQWRLLDSKAKY